MKRDLNIDTVAALIAAILFPVLGGIIFFASGAAANLHASKAVVGAFAFYGLMAAGMDAGLYGVVLACTQLALEKKNNWAGLAARLVGMFVLGIFVAFARRF